MTRNLHRQRQFRQQRFRSLRTEALEPRILLAASPGDAASFGIAFCLGSSLPESGAAIVDPVGNANLAGSGALEAADLPALTVSINDVRKTEGNSLTSNAVFTVTLSTASTQTITVAYATAAAAEGDKATAGKDYKTKTGTLTFKPGVTSRTIVVPVVGDTIDEPDEVFLVKLSNPVNVALGDDTGVGTIVDNDAAPTLSISSVGVTEGNPGGDVTAVFTVSLSAASGKTVTVDVNSADNTATTGADYTAKTETLQFDPGARVKTVSVTVLGDLLDEATETFRLNLSNAANAAILRGSGTGTITDNDPTPKLSINDVPVDESAGNAVFTVTLSAVSGRAVTVNYSTRNGSAAAGSDYTAIPTTPVSRLTIPAGQPSGTIAVSILDDTIDEPDETFLVKLAAPVNATILDGSGTGTIVDGNQDPTIIVDDGQAGFATSGSWTVSTSAGYLKDYRSNAKGSGADAAIWTFNVVPGVYRVSATWVPSTTGRATNAPYTIFDGTTELGAVTVNQQQVPNDLTEAGVGWKHLGDAYYVYGTELKVKLTDLANNTVAADAVRVERVGDLTELRGPESDPANAHLPRARLQPAVAEEFTKAGGISISRRTIAVVFSAATTVGEANDLLESIGATIAGGEPLINTLFLSLPDDGNLATTMATVQQLNADPRVVVAVPNALGESRGLPSQDFAQAVQDWTWETTPGGGNNGLELIRAPQAWNLQTYGQRHGGNANAGVIDAGFATSHEDLAPRIHSPAGTPVDDHGTHVSGIIAATWNDSLGVEGVAAHNPELFAYAYNTGNRYSPFPWLQDLVTLYRDILYDHPDVVVVNASYGLPTYEAWVRPQSDPVLSESGAFKSWTYSQFVDALGILYDAAATAFAKIVRDDFLIASAVGYDARPGIVRVRDDSPMNNAAIWNSAGHYLAVEAVDQDNAYNPSAWGFGTNLGGTVSAPGIDILSTVSGNQYQLMSGTSMATPHVTGLISYLWHLDPSLTFEEVRKLVTDPQFTRTTDSPTYKTQPRIDAFAAAMGIDLLQGNMTLQQALVDVDDGTLDGNARFDHDDWNNNGQTGAELVDGSVTTDRRRGDGAVDIKDFRAYRDAMLQILADQLLVSPLDVDLDGDWNHPKKDLNQDGHVNANPLSNSPYAFEGVYPRFDFNGSGDLEPEGALAAPNAAALAPFKIDPDSPGNNRDIDVLADPAIWTDLDVTDGELLADRDGDGVIDYVYSADLHFRLEKGLVPTDDFQIKIESLGSNGAPLWQKTIAPDGAWDKATTAGGEVLKRVVTVPLFGEREVRITVSQQKGDAVQSFQAVRYGKDLMIQLVAPKFNPAKLSQTEGSTGGTKVFDLGVTLAKAVPAEVFVDYTTANGTAKADSDYKAESHTERRFAANQTAPASAFIVNVVADKAIESNETFEVSLGSTSSAQGGTADDPVLYFVVPVTGTVTIVNDDAVPVGSELWVGTLDGINDGGGYYDGGLWSLHYDVSLMFPGRVGSKSIFGGSGTFVGEEIVARQTDPLWVEQIAHIEPTSVDRTVEARSYVRNNPWSGSIHLWSDSPLIYQHVEWVVTGTETRPIYWIELEVDQGSATRLTGTWYDAGVGSTSNFSRGTFVLNKVAGIKADMTTPASPATGVMPLTLDPVFEATFNQALASWAAAGISNDAMRRLGEMRIEITDLPGSYLAAAGDRIYVDRDAAGYGWYVPPTPWRNEEFTPVSRTAFRAPRNSPAAGRMDLLTVLRHEIGHELGLDDLDAEAHPNHLMAGTLAPGVRRALRARAACAAGVSSLNTLSPIGQSDGNLGHSSDGLATEILAPGRRRGLRPAAVDAILARDF